jgi:hypothetical protein
MSVVNAPMDPPRRTTIRQVILALLLPLFFAVLFPMAYGSATHAPTPNHLQLMVVGPEQVVGKIATQLDRTGKFDTASTDVVSEARKSVRDRDAVGALVVAVKSASSGTSTSSGTSAKSPSGGAASGASSSAAPAASSAQAFSVRTYIATGGGRSSAAAVTATGAQIATQLKTTSTVVEVAPVSKADPLGNNLFYLLVYTALAAYMVIILMGQVWPRSRLSTRFLVIACAAVFAPLIAFGLSSIFAGDYGASFGTIMGLLGVDSLFILTVGSLAILLQQFLKSQMQFGVFAFVVFLGFPSAGGAIPESMMPTFWQDVHNVYFSAGAYESFRSIVYFGGHGASRWILQLMAWLVAFAAAAVIVHLAKLILHRRPAGIPTGSPDIDAPSSHRHVAGTITDRPYTATGSEPARALSAPVTADVTSATS